MSLQKMPYPEKKYEGYWVSLLDRLEGPAAGVTTIVSEGLSLAWSWPEDHVEEQSWPMVGSWHAGQQ